MCLSQTGADCVLSAMCCRGMHRLCLSDLSGVSARFWVEAIGRTSNLLFVNEKWTDLQKRIAESPPRPHLSGQDVPKSRAKRFLSSQDISDIVRRYRAGETTQQVGTRYGISKTRIATILREQDVTIRRQGLTTEQASKAAALYAAGKSLASIGAKFNVSHTTVAVALRQQGVQLRGRPGWQ